MSTSPPAARRLHTAAHTAGLTSATITHTHHRDQTRTQVTIDGLAHPDDSHYRVGPALSWIWVDGRLAGTDPRHTLTLTQAHHRLAERVWERDGWWRITFHFTEEPGVHPYIKYGPTLDEALAPLRRLWPDPDRVRMLDARRYDPTRPDWWWPTTAARANGGPTYCVRATDRAEAQWMVDHAWPGATLTGDVPECRAA
ncbi:hypothetical protein [Nocardiopsis sp. JB363]|uniref:hypothetical protein n=1 Tax=Nocardiopsis sp. JB363 TaxID=1434837 RepID=UPI00097A5AC5|nr:hypothetical protein [Nocardiopsis sp. JB363]SIO84630.1 hypothetical protein BQ8420_02880 [Nocardiopsis sp. JB363]